MGDDKNSTLLWVKLANFQVCLDFTVIILHLMLMLLPSKQWSHLQIILLLLVVKGFLACH